MIIIFILLVALVISMIRIVPEAHCYVIELLGSYKATWHNGIHFKLPLVERVARRISMKEQMCDFPPQPVITKDNVSMKIDTVVFYKIVDARKFVYGAENPILALENLTATTLRNIIGTMDLDETLSSRDKINSDMTVALDEATDPWGIKVMKVELKTITPPADIQSAMEKQMQAERNKRVEILKAEGHKEASIRRAQGETEATILYANAEKEAAIAKATGEAESKRLLYEAEAAGLKLLNESNINANVLSIKKLEALKELGNGQATKLVVPTELTTAAASLDFVKEIFTPQETQKTEEEYFTANELDTMNDPCCDTYTEV